MWKLKYFNQAMGEWYEMSESETEQDARNILQQWIDDEYYSSEIKSFSEEEFYSGMTVIYIDNEIFGIWEEE